MRTSRRGGEGAVPRVIILYPNVARNADTALGGGRAFARSGSGGGGGANREPCCDADPPGGRAEPVQHQGKYGGSQRAKLYAVWRSVGIFGTHLTNANAQRASLGRMIQGALMNICCCCKTFPTPDKAQRRHGEACLAILRWWGAMEMCQQPPRVWLHASTNGIFADMIPPDLCWLRGENTPHATSVDDALCGCIGMKLQVGVRKWPLEIKHGVALRCTLLFLSCPPLAHT